MGTIAGFGTWFALILKTAFALVGMGAYLGLFFPSLELTPIAAGFALLFGLINWWGAKKSGSAQAVLVTVLLILLAGFIGFGLPAIQAHHFTDLFRAGGESFIATTGLVVVSYMGLTKIASVAEEVRNPERNIPLGTFLALGSALVIFVAGTGIMVGVLSPEELAGNITPVASAAEVIFGPWGAIVMTIAAMAAFASVGNAGILSASRYPFAMSRDHLLPGFFRKVSRSGAPGPAIAVTLGLILAFVVLFDPTKIAKLASSFQLLMFALNTMAVIVLRESHIASYDPGYRSPGYPWVHAIGIVAPLWLIFQMGFLAVGFTMGIIVVGSIWYRFYARDRVVRSGAIYHLFERLGRSRFEGLDSEFRTILKEKGLRDEDPFDEIVARAAVVELDGPREFEGVTTVAARLLALRTPETAETIQTRILEGTRVGATPVTHGVALPHMHSKGLSQSEMVLVRSKAGVRMFIDDPLTEGSEVEAMTAYAVFYLISPEDDPAQHLRILAQIAGRVDEASFMQDWNDARDEQELKEVLLRDERFLSITIIPETLSGQLIGQAVRDLALPKQSLIALVRRDGETLVPDGATKLEPGDRVTFIGHPAAIARLNRRFDITQPDVELSL